MPHHRSFLRLCGPAGPPILAALAGGAIAVCAEPGLFAGKRLTPNNEYTRRIEGPAVDAAGNLYVMNFGADGMIGRIRPGSTQSEVFAPLPPGSIGSGARFDRDGRMYVADFKQHNIFVFEPGATTPRVYFHSDAFHQPNDLAIAADGTLYASDPDFNGGKGRIWRITRDANGNGQGEIMSSRQMGVTNGLDISPDEKILYVSESNTHQLWAYRIDGTQLTATGPLAQLGAEIDGVRTDRSGRIFVAQVGAGTIAIVPAAGGPVVTVPLQGKQPSNLTFGGPDGKTVFVTQVIALPQKQKKGFVESFRSDTPGREPCLPFKGAFC